MTLNVEGRCYDERSE